MGQEGCDLNRSLKVSLDKSGEQREGGMGAFLPTLSGLHTISALTRGTGAGTREWKQQSHLWQEIRHGRPRERFSDK